MKKKLILIFFAFFFAHCARYASQPGQANVNVQFSSNSSTFSEHLQSQIRDQTNIPLSVSSFDCFFVNAMGSGIGDWTSNASMAQIPPNAYFGLYSSLISAVQQGSVTLQVATGSKRIIQIIGVKSNIGCPARVHFDQLSSLTNFPIMYELARTTIDIFHDISLNLLITYDPTTALDVRTNQSWFPKNPGSFTITSATAGDGQVTLAWGNSSNATSYTVKRGTSPGTYTTTIPAAASPFLDTGLADGTTYYYMVTANNQSGSTNASVEISALPYGVPSLSYVGATGTTGTINTSMSVSPTTLSNSGSVITGCAVKAGTLALPSGLSVDSSTCVISGTLTVAATTATYTILATNAAGNSSDATISLTVNAGVPTLSYAGAIGTIGSVNAAMSVAPTILNNNGSSITGCAIKGGTTVLPSGLNVNSSTCVISGTPTVAAGSTIYTIVATNSVGNSTDVTVSLTVNAGVPTLSYAGAGGTTGGINTPMSVSPTALNGNGAAITGCAVKGGTAALPSGLTVNNSSCVISGTPTVSAGAATYTIVATNSAGTSADATVSLTVNSATAPTLSYAGATGTTGSLNVPMSVSPTTLANNGASITACGIKGGTTALPVTLTVDNSTCVISGTPTSSLSATLYTIHVTNSAGSTDATVTLSVNTCDASLYGGGSGTSGDPYQITTQTHLSNIASCTASTAYFQQTGDIALSGSWTPVPMYGTYDGQNHSISGLLISDAKATDNVGLFSTIYSTATVKNVNLTNVSVTGAGSTGALAGVSNGVITNCSSSGSVTLSSAANANEYMGGLVGLLSGSTAIVSNSNSSANVIIAAASGSYAPGAGGLVGAMQSSSSISSSYATGNVSLGANYTSGNPYLAGLVANIINSSVTTSYATGNLTAGFASTGINGSIGLGLIGYASGATVSKCFSKSTYSVPGFVRYTYLGSIIAYMQGGSITDSYGMVTMLPLAQSEPSNGGSIGGLVGSATSSPTIATSYSANPSMPLSVYLGTLHGFSGTPLGSGINSSYYYANGSVPNDSSAGVTSITSSPNMQNQGFFTGFTFDSTHWVMPKANALAPAGLLSPVLQWQCGSNGISC